MVVQNRRHPRLTAACCLDRDTTLPTTEVRAILNQLEGRAVHVIASVALATGMRRGELCALRWKDVDFNAALVRVERSLEQCQ